MHYGQSRGSQKTKTKENLVKIYKFSCNRGAIYYMHHWLREDGCSSGSRPSGRGGLDLRKNSYSKFKINISSKISHRFFSYSPLFTLLTFYPPRRKGGQISKLTPNFLIFCMI